MQRQMERKEKHDVWYNEGKSFHDSKWKIEWITKREKGTEKVFQVRRVKVNEGGKLFMENGNGEIQPLKVFASWLIAEIFHSQVSKVLLKYRHDDDDPYGKVSSWAV